MRNHTLSALGMTLGRNGAHSNERSRRQAGQSWPAGSAPCMSDANLQHSRRSTVSPALCDTLTGNDLLAGGSLIVPIDMDDSRPQAF